MLKYATRLERARGEAVISTVDLHNIASKPLLHLKTS